MGKMIVQEKTSPEIEFKLKQMSPFLQMEYLENCLKQQLAFDVKRFCNLELAKLYENRNMFPEAAKNMDAAAEIATTFKDRKEAYMKEAGIWIKASQYDRTDEAFKKALASGNAKEKEEMRKLLKEMFSRQAIGFEKASKNAHAARIYEKMLEMANEREKLEIKKKLVGFYQKLGRIREYLLLKGQLERQ